MSSPPKRSIVAATALSPAPSSPALAAKTSTSPVISAAAASSWSCLRLFSITFAPEAASDAAIALPIPFDAPVTSATFPSSEISMAADATSRRSPLRWSDLRRRTLGELVELIGQHDLPRDEHGRLDQRRHGLEGDDDHQVDDEVEELHHAEDRAGSTHDGTGEQCRE